MQNNHLQQQSAWQLRINDYHTLNQKLAKFDKQELIDQLARANLKASSFGGKNSLLQINNKTIFVKAIPLSDIECLSENNQSTANFFHLPLYYQYGIGSLGFGAWRELASCLMTNDWVLSGQCIHFPLLYQWRVIDMPPHTPAPTRLSTVKKEVAIWQNEPAIYHRHLVKYEASKALLLFLEYIPFTLHDWLQQLIKQNGVLKKALLQEIDNALTKILSFVNKQGVLHFDAHFKNILTDGQHVYLSDFGLAMSNQFKLSKQEEAFFKQHQTYDQASKAFFLIHWLIECFLKPKLNLDNDFSLLLQHYNRKKSGATLPPYLKSFKKYLPIASDMDQFYQALRANLENTTYPNDILDFFPNPLQRVKCEETRSAEPQCTR